MKPTPPIIIPAGQPLPVPRLQLRWEANPDTSDDHQWVCHYELVLPLQEGDIRREVYGDDGEVRATINELVVKIKDPQRRNTTATYPPCGPLDGSYFYDAPFRDGAHAKWDAAVLGNPTIFTIAPDGTAIQRPEDTTP